MHFVALLRAVCARRADSRAVCHMCGMIRATSSARRQSEVPTRSRALRAGALLEAAVPGQLLGRVLERGRVERQRSPLRFLVAAPRRHRHRGRFSHTTSCRDDRVPCISRRGSDSSGSLPCQSLSCKLLQEGPHVGMRKPHVEACQHKHAGRPDTQQQSQTDVDRHGKATYMGQRRQAQADKQKWRRPSSPLTR